MIFPHLLCVLSGRNRRHVSVCKRFTLETGWMWRWQIQSKLCTGDFDSCYCCCRYTIHWSYLRKHVGLHQLKAHSNRDNITGPYTFTFHRSICHYSSSVRPTVHPPTTDPQSRVLRSQWVIHLCYLRRGSSEVTAPDFLSSVRPVFDSTCCRVEAFATSFTPVWLRLSEKTLEAVGPFYVVPLPEEAKY